MYSAKYVCLSVCVVRIEKFNKRIYMIRNAGNVYRNGNDDVAISLSVNKRRAGNELL